MKDYNCTVSENQSVNSVQENTHCQNGEYLVFNFAVRMLTSRLERVKQHNRHELGWVFKKLLSLSMPGVASRPLIINPSQYGLCIQHGNMKRKVSGQIQRNC